MKQKNKKGFTLVELSIVLVIIGLLIGGILVGQSLIESAKMQSFIRQMGQYDAAVALFDDKFGALPGDNTLFTAKTYTGTGAAKDGKITMLSGAVTDYSGEIDGFWNELSQAGLKNDNGGAYALISAVAGPVGGDDVPKAAIGNGGIVIPYYQVAVAASADDAAVDAGNYFRVFIEVDDDAVIETAVASTNLGIVKPADALAIDGKLDDGKPSSGNVRAQDVAGTTLAYTTLTTAASSTAGCGTNNTALATNNSTYNPVNPNVACHLMIRMGVGTGVLQ